SSSTIPETVAALASTIRRSGRFFFNACTSTASQLERLVVDTAVRHTRGAQRLVQLAGEAVRAADIDVVARQVGEGGVQGPGGELAEKHPAEALPGPQGQFAHRHAPYNEGGDARCGRVRRLLPKTVPQVEPQRNQDPEPQHEARDTEVLHVPGGRGPGVAVER